MVEGIITSLLTHRSAVRDEGVTYSDLSEKVQHLKILIKIKTGCDERNVWLIGNRILDMRRAGMLGWPEKLKVQVDMNPRKKPCVTGMGKLLRWLKKMNVMEYVKAERRSPCPIARMDKDWWDIGDFQNLDWMEDWWEDAAGIDARNVNNCWGTEERPGWHGLTNRAECSKWKIFIWRWRMLSSCRHRPRHCWRRTKLANRSNPHKVMMTEVVTMKQIRATTQFLKTRVGKEKRILRRKERKTWRSSLKEEQKS